MMNKIKKFIKELIEENIKYYEKYARYAGFYNFYRL